MIEKRPFPSHHDFFWFCCVCCCLGFAQPALLYLVPCTLGLFVFISYNDGTLRSMWDGPPSLSADHAGYDGLLSDESSIGGHEGGEGGRGGGAQLSGRDGVSPLSDSGEASYM